MRFTVRVRFRVKFQFFYSKRFTVRVRVKFKFQFCYSKRFTVRFRVKFSIVRDLRLALG